jgi:hypothetical protein
MIATASRAVEDMRKKAALWNEHQRIVPQRIEHVAFFLAAPWSATTVKTLHFSRTKPFKMTFPVLERMLAEEEKAADTPEHMLLIERTAVSLRLNGYDVDSIPSSLVTSADVTLASSTAVESLHAHLTDLARHMPGSPRISFHSFALPAMYAIRAAYPAMKEALIIDAGAEVTEIVVIKGGIPTARATAPSGTHILLRTLATHAHMGAKEADTALSLAAHDGTRLSAELREPLESAAGKWAEKVSQALAPLATHGLPLNVFLFGDTRAVEWLARALSASSLPSVASTLTPRVQAVTAEALLPFVESFDPAADPFLLCELLYADTRFDEGRSLSLVSTQDGLVSRTRGTLQRT